MQDDDVYVSRCPACGEPIDYCLGHGAIGDPAGAYILQAHDDGDHTQCDPRGCDEADGNCAECGHYREEHDIEGCTAPADPNEQPDGQCPCKRFIRIEEVA